jgi:peptide chain release factor subunit 1
MITDRDLQELLDYQAQHSVLSVYLNTDPAEGNADTYKLRLRSMLKDADIPEDEDVVIRYFDRGQAWRNSRANRLCRGGCRS